MTSRVFLTSLCLVSAFGLALPSRAADGPVYELRIYTTNEGKLPDLLKRFREHTCKLFEKHGMSNIGYWVPVDKENGSDNTLVYIISHKSREEAKASWKAFVSDPVWKEAAKASEANGKILAKAPESIFMLPTEYSPPVKTGVGSAPRIFEMRTYTTPEGKLPALHARFTNHTMKFFEKHGMTNLFYFTPTDAAKGEANKLIYWLAHPSKEAGLQAFTNFRADPGWVKAKGESEKDGPLTVQPQAEGVKSVYMQATDFSPIK
ncbi:MAG: NIPSNAP family protein [Roseimicrobium sp.]